MYLIIGNKKNRFSGLCCSREPQKKIKLSEKLDKYVKLVKELKKISRGSSRFRVLGTILVNIANEDGCKWKSEEETRTPKQRH